MNYRTLLVVLDGNPACDWRTRLAARLATSHGSHLVGMAPTGLIELSSGLGAAARYLEDIAAARTDAIGHATGWVDRFQTLCRAAGVASLEADVHEGKTTAAILLQAHCADLVVMGQAEPGERQAQHLVEQMLLHNPRPTLVVPCRGPVDVVGEDVLIAWDDSHGSARAVADAMPLLQRARRVRVRAWRRHGEIAEQAVLERLLAVRRWLERQDVVCEVRVDTTAAGIGHALVDSAVQLGADLIVMGSYGHSPWSERLLGGATRHALTHSPVPLLMSH